MTTTDPTRLINDATAGALLRDDLVVASAAQVRGLNIAGGAAQLQAAIGAETGSIATVGSAGIGASAIGKTVVGLAVIGAIAWWGLRDDAPSDRGSSTPMVLAKGPDTADRVEPPLIEPRAVETQPAVAPDPALSPLPVAVEPIPDEEIDPVADEPTPDLEPAPRTKASKAASVAKTNTASSDDDAVVREAKQIQAARQALGSDPAHALSLTQSIATEFPAGQLVEEREAIAIRALAKLDRRDEARTRADAFLSKYGRGPHAAAVRRAIE